MRRLLLLGTLIIALAITVFTMIQHSVPSGNTISVEDVLAAMKSDTNLVILDVRTREEFAGPTGHLQNAVLLPLQELEKRIDELSTLKKRKIVTYCRTARRSGIATELLGKRGFNVVNMEGGIVRWNALEYPVVHEKP